MSQSAVLLTSTPVLAKQVARILGCAGVSPSVANDIDGLRAAISNGADFAFFGGEMLDQIVPVLKDQPRTRALVWTGEKEQNTVSAAPLVTQLNNIFGLRYPNAPPRSWELLRVARRLAGSVPPPETLLDWGATVYHRSPGSTAELDDVVAEVERFAGQVNGRRCGASMAEVAHELLMNAMYDAPVDPAGKPLFAFRREEAIELNAEQRPDVHYGSDGSRFMISVSDPFGGLQREHVFGGIARASSSASLDRSGGGAGLGMGVIHNAVTLVFFDVVRGYRTQAAAVLELDVPQRELRALPRSVHFFQQEP
jgi:hypothetical protein